MVIISIAYTSGYSFSRLLCSYTKAFRLTNKPPRQQCLQALQAPYKPLHLVTLTGQNKGPEGLLLACYEPLIQCLYWYANVA